MNNDITPTVASIGELNISGLLLDHRWLHAIQFDSGKADVTSCLVLAEIVYWYRPRAVLDEQTGALLGYCKRFKADKLQRSYQALADKLGLTKRQIKESCDRLEAKGLVSRELRTIKTEGGKRLNNVLFIEPVPARVKEITGPQSSSDTLSRQSIPPSYVSTGEPPTLERTTPPTLERRTNTRDSSIQEIDPTPPPARARARKVNNINTTTTHVANEMPDSLESLSKQVKLPKDISLDYVPGIPLEWADFFQRRCGMSRDKTLRPIKLLRRWCDQRVTLEEMEMACQRVESRSGFNPDSPNYYEPIIEQIRMDCQHAKESPAARGTSTPGMECRNPGGYRPYQANTRQDTRHETNTHQEGNYEAHRRNNQPRKLSAAERAVQFERNFFKKHGINERDITDEISRIA